MSCDRSYHSGGWVRLGVVVRSDGASWLWSGDLSQRGQSEADALAISANIQAKHLPFGTILDPIYASPTSDQIVGYTRCGDSALWTGAYLAAEAFRYNVTRSADALKQCEGGAGGPDGRWWM